MVYVGGLMTILCLGILWFWTVGEKGEDLTSVQALSSDDWRTGRVSVGSKIREKNIMGGSVLLLKEQRYKMNSELRLS